MKQQPLWCRHCGAGAIHAFGLCSSCYSEHLRFGGLRPRVLAREERCCLDAALHPDKRVCHHRVPGRNRETLLVGLCRGCHARVHHAKRVRWHWTPLLRALWREQHRGIAEQLPLPLATGWSAPEPRQLSF